MPYFLSLLMMFFAGSAQAQVLDDYQITVKVENQTPTARDKALREALAGVLVTVSGSPTLASTGRTAPILARASALVRSVGYITDEKNELQLIAVFDPEAVETALKQQGLPVHGVQGAKLEEVSLSISDISSVQDYARALAALRNQSGVKNLSVTSASGSSLTVSLHAEGGAARLIGALSVGGVLRRDSASPDSLHYSLIRR